MKLPLLTRIRMSQSTRTSRYTVSGALRQRQPRPVSLARGKPTDRQTTSPPLINQAWGAPLQPEPQKTAERTAEGATESGT